MVEFALVLPIFIALMSGMIDLGFALYSKMTVINAAREGAHAAIAAPDYSKVPQLVTSAATSAASGTSLDMTKVTIPTPTCVAVATTPPPCNWGSGPGTLAKRGDSVSVRVNYTFVFLFGVGTIDLGSTVQMVLDQ